MLRAVQTDVDVHVRYRSPQQGSVPRSFEDVEAVNSAVVPRCCRRGYIPARRSVWNSCTAYAVMVDPSG